MTTRSPTILGNNEFFDGSKQFFAITLLIIWIPCCAGIPEYFIGTKINKNI
jgi:hypothetical protein